jgi:hypothetical protein
MTQRVLIGMLLSLAVIPYAKAQGDENDPAPDLGPLMETWRAEHGDEWRSATDAETGFLEMLYGGHTSPSALTRDDAQFFELARTALEEARAMHGIDGATLENLRTLHLPLGIIGSNDKMTVRFRQVVNGVPVEWASSTCSST